MKDVVILFYDNKNVGFMEHTILCTISTLICTNAIQIVANEEDDT